VTSNQRRSVREAFETTYALSAQPKGYELEKIFASLMRISGIAVQKPFRIVGEQFDGAIQHEGHYDLVEVKWFAEPLEPKHISSFLLRG
jgi:hypothetical protein